MKKKVVTIALFGDGDRYSQYLGTFVRAHLNLFPIDDGWTLQVRAAADLENGRAGVVVSFLHALELARLVELAWMPPAPLTKAMLWRLAPAFDDDVEYAFCRDLDALPAPRDRAAVEQFIASRATVHTIHDNLAHCGIMGGLSGFWAPAFRRAIGLQSLAELYRYSMRTEAQWRCHGTDQDVLNQIIDRRGGPILLEHRFNGWTNGEPTPQRRPASFYQCTAYSTPTPDVGVSPLSAELTAAADRLAPHLGSAGYDHQAARQFWDRHGAAEIARAVAACEAP